MKKTILTIAIAGFFAACNSKPSEISTVTTTTAKVVEDTTGLAQFKEWKEQQQITNTEAVNEVQEDINTSAVNETKVERPTEKPRVVVHQPVRERSVARKYTPVQRATSQRPVRTREANGTDVAAVGDGSNKETTTSAGSSTGTNTGTSDGDIAGTQPETAEAKKDEGWSKAAKGATIGAGSGAVVGAIISKKKGKGAVIGGVIGAAGGYVLGRKQDKKEGRY
jgi:hypothetical protein